MTAAVLLKELESLGATVTTDGEALRIKAPKGIITPAMADAVRRHKPELLALLAGSGEPANDPPATISEVIPEATRRRLVEAWRGFLLEHGPTLHAHDWTPRDMVGDLDPETATTWPEVPGLG